jgi:2,4-dienoyl-CoA reductase-like NADH-dependent reductase (Old Yellow Enzyme family)
MDSDLQRAFSPLRLGPLELANRFIKSSTFEGMMPGNRPSAALARLHAGIAAGGVAMTTLGFTAIEPDGRTFAEEAWICHDKLPAWRALTAAVHAAGARASLQLGHCGTLTRTPDRRQRRPGGPSATLNLYGAMVGALRTRALTEADMEEIAGSFVTACRLAAEAGFDAVEIHMGHGYLLSQFLSPLGNRRSDRHGGPIENRMRFPVEVLRRVVAAVGDRLAVLVKLNLEDGARGGLVVEEAATVAAALQAAGAHGLVLTGGFTPHSPMYLFRGESPAPAMRRTEKSAWNRFLLRLGERTAFRSLPFAELYFLEQARRIRAAVSLPLGLLGGIRSAGNVAQAMREGFDFVVLGRPLLAEPDFVRRIAADPAARSKCTNCNQCVAEFARPGGVRCVLNPENDPALNLRAAG